MVVSHVQCYFLREIIKIIDFRHTECAGRELHEIEPVAQTKELASALMWTGIVLGIVCLVVLAVLIAFRVRMIEHKMSRRAVDRFVVPSTRPREASVDVLEQAAHWEPGSLPDLLAAVPSSLTNSRSVTNYILLEGKATVLCVGPTVTMSMTIAWPCLKRQHLGRQP